MKCERMAARYGEETRRIFSARRFREIPRPRVAGRSKAKIAIPVEEQRVEERRKREREREEGDGDRSGWIVVSVRSGDTRGEKVSPCEMKRPPREREDSCFT